MVIEVETFHLAAGVDEAAFLEADERVQVDFMHQQPGFVRRTTARGHDGEWLVVAFWDSSEAARTAAQAARADPTVVAFGALLDASDVKRYATLD